ncbi:hypothetical protein V1506DRAFT_579655 [Lipomyces tetrasporus]
MPMQAMYNLKLVVDIYRLVQSASQCHTTDRLDDRNIYAVQSIWDSKVYIRALEEAEVIRAPRSAVWGIVSVYFDPAIKSPGTELLWAVHDKHGWCTKDDDDGGDGDSHSSHQSSATELSQVRVVAHNERVYISPVVSINFPNMTHEQHVGLQQIYEHSSRRVDVPGLYDPHGRYEYWHGLNWRALVAFVVSLGPNLPGLANSVSPSLGLTGGIVHLWDVNYLYGFYVAVFVYVGLSLIFPAKETLVPEMISGDVWPGTVDAESEIIEGIGEEGSLDTSEEKKQVEVESEKF